MQLPDYILPLQEAFLSNANPSEAVAMKKYMKDKFEFFGIKSPLRKEIYKNHKDNFGLLPDENFEQIVRWCWNQDQREYQYFAMEFLGRRKNKAQIQIIDLYEVLISRKSWWDTIDFIAAHLLGSYFTKYPEQILPVTNKWMRSGNIWLQRSCLLFQLKYKGKTNEKLLTSFIVELTGTREFFINKAIGWALREYSKTNPRFVKDFVSENHLSGLSRREALKWMQDRGLVIKS